MARSIEALHAMGQSLWYDNIQRCLLENGELAELVQKGEIRGITSNPSIFNNAITKTHDYDAALLPMAWSGWTAEQIFTQLTIEDIRAAADLFLPLYEESDKADGYVSLEVSPYLADSTASTVEEAQRLWEAVMRPNLMVKIPATRAGIPAIRETIARGINVNVTLIFSLVRYAEVMEAYLSGLEARVKAGKPVTGVASVASFFVSRVDTKVDHRLQEIIRQEKPEAGEAANLMGRAAIANARLAYTEFLMVFGSQRFKHLQTHGARVQRPLWASTSTKNPQYSDVMYVDELIGPDTVNTVPPQTLEAFRDHGEVRPSLVEDTKGARAVLARLESLGVSMEQVTGELENEGVQAFSDAFKALIESVEDRRALAIAQLGPLQSRVPMRVGGMEQDEIAQRLFDGEGVIFSGEAAEHFMENGYRALRATGVPIGEAGEMDERALRNRETWMLRQITPDVPAGRNPGLVLGAILSEAAQVGRNKVVLMADEPWRAFAEWLARHFDEHCPGMQATAIGATSEPPEAAEDAIYIYLSSDGSQEALTAELRIAKQTAVTLPVGGTNDLGAEVMRWELAMAAGCGGGAKKRPAISH